MRCAGPAAQLVAFKCFGGIVNLDPIGARHALALTVVAARKVLPASFSICQKTPTEQSVDVQQAPCILLLDLCLKPIICGVASAR